MVDVRGILGNAAELLLVAVRSFLLTLLLLLFLGVALAAASYWILSGSNWVYAVVAALVALIECIVVGIILAAKRAIAVTLVHGLRKHRIGSAAVRMVFDRLLGVKTEELHGERGGWMTRTAEHCHSRRPRKASITRSTASSMLPPKAAVRSAGCVAAYRADCSAPSTNTRWYTSATKTPNTAASISSRCGTTSAHIDGMLIGKLRGGINLWTITVLVGLPVQILALDYVVFALLK